MSSTSMLPGAFQAQIQGTAGEVIGETYGELAGGPQNVIPLIAEVKPVSMMSKGIYDEITQEVADDVGKGRKMGDAVSPGSVRENLTVYAELKFFARSYTIPSELATYSAGDAANLSGVQRWAAGRGEEFARARFEFEQTEFAKFFNEGGLTAGSSFFENGGGPYGVPSSPGGKLLPDGVELFNLTGNARTALSGDTYYNGVALSFSGTSLGTLENLVADTNGWSTTKNRRLANRPNLIVYASSLRKTVKEVIDARGKSGGADNDANAFGDYRSIEMPYLTTATQWAIGRQGAGLRWYQDDRAPTMRIDWDRETNSDVLFIQSAYAAIVVPDGWRYWGSSNAPTS